MTSTTSRQFTYPQAIVETARRNGWYVRSEKTAGNAALVVTDGRSTVRRLRPSEVKASAVQKRRDEALREHAEWRAEHEATA